MLIAAHLAPGLARNGRVGAASALTPFFLFLQDLSGVETPVLLSFRCLAPGLFVGATCLALFFWCLGRDPGLADPWLPGLRFSDILRFIPGFGLGYLETVVEKNSFGTFYGGTVAEEPPEFPVYGLSPRGRGNRPRYLCAGTRMRSIPAWAGEPPGRLQSKMGKPVYPRVGGGTPRAYTPTMDSGGTDTIARVKISRGLETHRFSTSSNMVLPNVKSGPPWWTRTRQHLPNARANLRFCMLLGSS